MFDVGYKAAGTNAEVFLRQPFVAQQFFYQRVILHRVFGRTYAARYFDAHLPSAQLVVLFDHAANGVYGFERGAGITFTRRRLNEVGMDVWTVMVFGFVGYFGGKVSIDAS